MYNITKEEFGYHITARIDSILGTMLSKQKEYAEGDKTSPFHNFLLAAELEGVTPEQALRGMMTKHVVSIYDMLKDPYRFSMDQWREKIGDNTVYLLILEAMLSAAYGDLQGQKEEPTKE